MPRLLRPLALLATLAALLAGDPSIPAGRVASAHSIICCDDAAAPD